MGLKTLLLEHPRVPSPCHYHDVVQAPLMACLMSGYVAAVLERHGFEVKVYDAYLEGASFEQAFATLRADDWDVLGVHGVYFWEGTPVLFSFLERLKQSRPETLIVLYGIFPTAAWKEILSRCQGIDAIVLGEPEETFLQLVSMAGSHGRNAWQNIAGIAYRSGAGSQLNSPRLAIELLDQLPFPTRTQHSLKALGGSILGSRGCPGACSFCCISNYYGRGSHWRGRSIENIVSEIESLVPLLEQRYVYFLDASFFGSGPQSHDRALGIADALRGLRVEFGIECRSIDVADRLIARLAAAGLRDVFLGIESASPAGLERMNKGIAPEQNLHAVEVLRAHGIEPNLGFIMFEPRSSLEDIRTNFDFLKSQGLLTRLHSTADLLYHREIVLKGMQNFAMLEQAGLLAPTDMLGYEGCYQFAEPAVWFLAELMSAICRRVLRAMENPQLSICWLKQQAVASRRINDYLVAFFAKTLRQLECKEVRLNAAMLERAAEDALDHIEGLIVEERICQS